MHHSRIFVTSADGAGRVTEAGHGDASREWGGDYTLGFRYLIRCGRPPLYFGQGRPLAMVTASVGSCGTRREVG